MKINRFRALPFVVALGLAPALLVDGSAGADVPASDTETHGYSSVTELTDEVLEKSPGLGQLTESVPEYQLIHGGPDILTDDEGSAVADN